jgi:hypothetical protein
MNDEFTMRIAGLSPAQQGLLRQLILELVSIVENPQLPAVLLHVLPSADDAPLATVTAHCLSDNPHEAHRMLMEFLHAHAAVNANMPAPGAVRH